MKFIDITGQRFGKLVAIDYEKRNGVVYYKCRCDCGNEIFVLSQHLRRGDTKSCGCGRYGIRIPNNYNLDGEYAVCLLDNGIQFIFDKDDYDKLKNDRWHIDKDGYVFTTFKGGAARLHRIIMDCPDGMIIDHINRDPLDNRKCNLRICTNQQNIWNRKTKGYSKVENGYRVNFVIDGKNCNIVCKTKEDAIATRNKLAEKYRGEFAYKGE